ncbi:MAG TPA: biotin/lipoyl-binding protein, partial [Polyangiaceae bacterium]|nr:biotin/lipoyl-binding protein [Polyangiaceae bacterium]
MGQPGRSAPPKRAIAAVVGVIVLVGALAWRVHAQQAVAHRPSGGSATVEGIEVAVSSKISGRLREVAVQAGDRVKRSQVIARLDCMDQEAILRSAQAQLHVAQAQVEVAGAQAMDARSNAAVATSRTVSARAEDRSVTAAYEQAARDADRTDHLHREGA